MSDSIAPMKDALAKQSVDAGVGVILTHLLDEARNCSSHVKVGAINEVSLHDFRVSIRRLRVWFNAIDEDRLVSVPKSCHRRLKRLVSMTNQARDLDVHIALLKKHSKGLTKGDKACSDQIVEKWARKVEALRQTSTRQIEQSFAEVDADCIRVISEMTKGSAHKLLLSFWVGSVFSRRAKRLDSQLKGVKSIGDEEKIHKARLSAKALRYLAEAFVSDSVEALHLVDELRELQNVIGSLRDTQTLMERVKNSRKMILPEAVLKGIKRREKILFKEFAKNHRNAPRFQNKAQLLFASLVQRS